MPEPVSALCPHRLLDVNKAAGQATSRSEISMTGRRGRSGSICQTRLIHSGPSRWYGFLPSGR